MKLDTPKAILAGFLLVALPVFASWPRYVAVEPSAAGASYGLVAVRMDTRTGKAVACFMSNPSSEDLRYKITCDGLRR